MSVTYGLSGKVAVITGAANGFGLAVASRAGCANDLLASPASNTLPPAREI